MIEQGKPYLTAKRRRWEYFKLILTGLTLLVVVANATSYVLAWRGMDTNSAVTEGINLTYGAALIAYAIKSAWDHNSANKYKVQMVDENDENAGG